MHDFRIKICGITRAEDALAAVAAGADAIGLNLSSTSKRRVSATQAGAIVAQIRQVAPAVRCVGVFVEQSPAESEALAEQIGLDVIQLHGDHDATVMARKWSRPVLWVTRVPVSAGPEMAGRLSTIAAEVLENLHRTLGKAGSANSGGLAGILVDAYAAGDYGGTGKTVAWEPLGQRDQWEKIGWAPRPWPTDLPLVLAGGLTAENVASAIQQARPSGVDVASGVEIEPGVKSAKQMRAFIASARQAMRSTRAT